MTHRFASRRSRHSALSQQASVAATLAAGLVLAGCARSNDVGPAGVIASAGQSPLESCLLSGGELTLRGAVDNNDVTEHGEVISFAASGERLAVGTVDGTIKLWTLDGFVASLSAGTLVYGAELGSTEPRDLAFLGEEIVSGDARGLVSAFQPSGGFRVLGGTTPEYSIVSVAISPAVGEGGARLAHADTSAGGNVLIRELEGDAVVGPLATDLATISDLQFLADGSLLVAGAGGPGGSLAIYDATGTRLATAVDTHAVRAVDAVGGIVAAVTLDGLDLYDEDLILRSHIADGVTSPLSVALSAHAQIAFTIVASGSSPDHGDDVSLGAWSTASGELLASVAVPAAVLVDTAPDADSAFVAASDGWVRAYGCAAPAR